MTFANDPTVKIVYLHGDLKEKYGESFRLAVNTVREACNALALMVPGFKQSVLGEKRDRMYRVVRGDLNRGFELDEETIVSFSIGDAPVHIVPVVQGAKDQGIGKIIFGALLFGAGALMGFGSGFTMTGAAATTGVQVARLGLGVMLSGVAQMLSPSPGSVSSESPDRRESFLFNGAVNRATQGLPVPLCYGKFLVGSVTVSAGIETDDVVVSDIETGSIPSPKNLQSSYTKIDRTIHISWDQAEVGSMDKNRFYKLTLVKGEEELVTEMFPIYAVGTTQTSYSWVVPTEYDASTRVIITLWTAIEMVAGSGKYQYSKPISTSQNPYEREPIEHER